MSNFAQPLVSEFDLQLSSGRVRVRRSGDPAAPMVLLLHGLSAHLHSFDALLDHGIGSDLQTVAVDLRGRGRSEITSLGSYGIASHVRDVFEIADQLGAQQLDLVGWSMGALIALAAAAQAPHRVRKLVLIDHAGAMDAAPLVKITKGLERLDLVLHSPQDYVEAIRLGGSIQPWSGFWERYYRYELHPVAGGYQPSTSHSACLEDLHDLEQLDCPALWRQISMPALLIRCTVPVAGGFIVPASERDRIQAAIPQLQVEELPFDHYIVMVERRTAQLIDGFLSGVVVKSTLNNHE